MMRKINQSAMSTFLAGAGVMGMGGVTSCFVIGRGRLKAWCCGKRWYGGWRWYGVIFW